VGSTRFAVALRACKEVTVDTQTISHFLLGNEAYTALTRVLFQSIEQGRLRAVVSSITVAELFTLPVEKGDAEMEAHMEAFFTEFPNVSIQPFDGIVAHLAARVRAESKLSLPDAAIVATAQHVRSDAIISNAMRWRNRFATPRLLLLDDYR